MRIITLFISILLLSCNPSVKSEKPSKIIRSSPKLDTLVSTLPTIDRYKIPSQPFLKLVKQIDSSGYIWDTTITKKITHYRLTDSILFVENYMFYKMKPEDTYIYQFYDFFISDTSSSRSSSGLINKAYHDKAISIFGYYYAQKKKGNYITDGLIEEWSFPSVQDAENAVMDISKVKSIIFTNTPSFTCRIDRYMYIFHVRASAFGNQLEKFFLRFVKENNAYVPDKDDMN